MGTQTKKANKLFVSLDNIYNTYLSFIRKNNRKPNYLIMHPDDYYVFIAQRHSQYGILEASSYSPEELQTRYKEATIIRSIDIDEGLWKFA